MEFSWPEFLGTTTLDRSSLEQSLLLAAMSEAPTFSEEQLRTWLNESRKDAENIKGAFEGQDGRMSGWPTRNLLGSTC